LGRRRPRGAIMCSGSWRIMPELSSHFSTMRRSTL